MAQQKQVADKVRASYRHVDLVFGPHALWRFPELLQKVYHQHGRVFSIDDSHGSIAEGLPIVREGGAKAWVSVMYGCNNFCTYCIVPYVQGRERSRDKACIVADVKSLIAEGYKEITLLGQNVNSYGKDLPEACDFADLLDELARLDGDFLLRFMTSHPKDASHKLLDTMARHEKIARHLHLPFQSGSTRILQAMNRGYSREEYLALVDYARTVMPDIVLTSDVIVGFPGETKEAFEETLSLVQQVRFDALFTFIYSPVPAPGSKTARPGAPRGKAAVVRRPAAGFRTPTLRKNTPPMSARCSGCWWTAKAVIPAGRSRPAQQAGAWCIWWVMKRPSAASKPQNYRQQHLGALLAN